MQIYVEVDGEGREVLCDVENDDELVAMNPKEQWLVDTFVSTAPADKLAALREQIDAAWAEYRQEMEDFQSECLRDERVFNGKRFLNGGF